MKLTKESFTKIIDGDIVRYSYNCNDTNFYLELIGQNRGRNIKVFKGSVDDRKDELTTTDSLEAWNYFENLLKECSGEQGSSGGGNLGKNPQQNPNILPLLAIGGSSGGVTKIALFAVTEDKSQVKLFDFQVSANTLPQPLPKNVFTVNWSDEEVTQLLKCEVILKEYDDITFEENPNSKVFLFIPKSIANQGGEEGGNTEKGQEQPGDDGQPTDKPGDDGQPTDKPGDDGQPTDKPGDDGQPTDKPGDDGQPTDKPGDDGQPTDKPGDDGQPTDKPGDDGQPTDKPRTPNQQTQPNDDDGQGKSNKEKIDFSDTILKLANSTDGEYNPSELLSIFRNTESGEAWLASNNFPKIKKDLNLPSSITPRQFSQEIINSK
jgi:hypothetical protein